MSVTKPLARDFGRYAPRTEEDQLVLSRPSAWVLSAGAPIADPTAAGRGVDHINIRSGALYNAALVLKGRDCGPEVSIICCNPGAGVNFTMPTGTQCVDHAVAVCGPSNVVNGFTWQVKLVVAFGAAGSITFVNGVGCTRNVLTRTLGPYAAGSVVDLRFRILDAVAKTVEYYVL